MQIRMLREIDTLFAGAPQSRKTLEAKEEMLQNLMEKYNDLLAEGRSEEAAFNIAIGSVGDISDLLEELGQEAPPKVAHFPEPDLSDYPDYDEPIPDQQQTDYARHHNAVIVAVAVMLYILSPVAVILFGGRMGLLLLFAMIAGATGLLIYNGMTGDKKNQRGQAQQQQQQNTSYDANQNADPFEAQFESRKMNKEQKKFFASISSALWLMTTALYMVISFATGAWHITWIIFLVAAAVNNVVKAFIDMYRRG